MTAHPDVVAFVRARLAEREEVALRALGGIAALVAIRHAEGRPPASAHPLPAWSYDAGHVIQAAPAGGSIPVAEPMGEDVGEHVTRNDPLAVLVLCHALREVLQLAEGTAAAAANLADAAPGTRQELLLRGSADAARRIAHRIARAWREHPEYLPEWEMHA